MKKTVIAGASENSQRYACLAAQMLTEYGHTIFPVGLRKGKIFNEEIHLLSEQPKVEDVHTVTLYVGVNHQVSWQDYILSLQPKRIIFNPGTENPGFEKAAQDKGIEVLEACTLVMLRTGQF